MNKTLILSNLQQLLSNTVYTQVPLSQLTSYKIGGLCDFLICPQSINELASVVRYIKNNRLKVYIIGNGTNILASDKGFRGIILSLKKLNTMKCRGLTIESESGVDLDYLVLFSVRKNLSGFENLSWIPGTVGGALHMNAGAHGIEIADLVKKIQVMSWNGDVSWIDKAHAGFGYRSAENLRNFIILKGEFSLLPGERVSSLKQRRHIITLRKQKQPLEFPSAGSVFKRPKGFYAGTLIQQAGLSGYRVGGAEVSTKHCGFIINRGKARASDVKSLIKHIQGQVQKKFGVSLEREQIFLGIDSH